MSTHRASLLAGLRTGGPRSVSTGAYNVPHTATVVGQFPSTSAQYSTGFGYEHEGNQFIPDSVGIPMTAPAKDATFSHFQRQQHAHPILLQAQAQAQALQNAVVTAQGGVPYGLQSVMTPDQQALHLQLEVYKMQAMHQQQLQAQIFQEAQRQMLYQHQQQQLPPRRRPSEPVTSGPLTASFGPQLRNRTPSGANEGSATAGLDGRFPASKPGLNPHAHSFQSGINETPAGNAAVSSNWRIADRSTPPAPPALGGNPATSGGTLLGTSITAQPPSARHTATSWRRPPLVKAEDDEPSASPPPAGSPSASPPAVYVSTPEETSPTESHRESPSAHRVRPQPLRFIVPPTIPDQVETDEIDGQFLPWLRTNDADAPSSPATPSSVSSVHSTAREEAARRLYEGLGLGRPTQPAIHAEPVRQVSQPARQPRGPPSGVEELGARNFASRIRRKAIGGLGALMDARGRRSSMIEVEAY